MKLFTSKSTFVYNKKSAKVSVTTYSIFRIFCIFQEYSRDGNTSIISKIISNNKTYVPFCDRVDFV